MSVSRSHDWSTIPFDILETITEHLKTYGDYLRFRAVCRTYRTLLPHFPSHNLPTQLPWLLLPSAFYDLRSGKTHTLILPEVSYPRRVFGSSHGSVIVVGDSPDIFCYNPLTNFKAFLAPLSTLPGVVSFSFANVGREYIIEDPLFEVHYYRDLKEIHGTFLSKVILSSSPTKDDCLAIAIINWMSTNELAYCKCGDSSWKSFPCGGFTAQDVIYSPSEELFYAVNQMGDVAYFSPKTSTAVEIIKNGDTIEGDLKYLVKSKGELLLVTRYLEAQADLISYCELYQTTRFGVYQFCEAGKGKLHWEPLTNLGDQMLFIGSNFSLALYASDFEGCKGNCIYYADDHSQSSEAGVYDLSNGFIEELPCYPQDGSAPVSMAPPVWFTPNPC